MLFRSPIYTTYEFTGNGNITETTSEITTGPYLAGNGSSTSTANNNYVSTIGAMLGGILPVENYTSEEELYVTNYIIGFTASVSDTAINYIASATNTPTERIYRASSGDDLALSFSEIQLSITNDTWHYLGPQLVGQ